MEIRDEIITLSERQCVSGWLLLGADCAWLHPQAPFRCSQAQARGWKEGDQEKGGVQEEKPFL